MKERSFNRRKSEFVLQNPLEMFFNFSVWTETLIQTKEYYVLTEGECLNVIILLLRIRDSPNITHT